MQAWSGQNSGGTPSPVRRLTATIILVFSLAGLIAGFSVGGLTSSRSNTTNTGSTKRSTPVVQGTGTITPTATVQPIVELKPPDTLNLSASTQIADGTTSYSMAIQVIDKHSKAIHAANITCKLWLVQRIPDKQLLNIDPNTLKMVKNLTNPITGMVNNQPFQDLGGLTFAANTPQTGFCNPNGQMTWNYTVAPAIPAGDYDLVVLTDWNGVHYNWAWDNITITLAQ